MKKGNRTKANILLNAYRLFEKVGYNNSEYGKIAELCGIKKTLVQYHYPKKIFLAQTLLKEILDTVIIYIQKYGLFSNEPLGNIYRIQQILFYYLLGGNQLFTFSRDILNSRELTYNISELLIEWTIQNDFMNLDQCKNNLLITNITMTIGAACEEAYRQAINNDTIETQIIAQTSTYFLLLTFGYSKSEIESFIKKYTISHKTLISLEKEISCHLKSELLQSVK